MKKLTLVFGLAVGFIAGSWAGRRPYESLEGAVKGMLRDPEVRNTLESAAESASVARDAALGATADVIDEASKRITNGAHKVASKVGDGS